MQAPQDHGTSITNTTEVNSPEISPADRCQFIRRLLSELLYVSSDNVAHREVTEITIAMVLGGFAGDEGTKSGIADPQHLPEILFAFQLCCFREFSFLAKT
jgi:hypothetical protein